MVDDVLRRLLSALAGSTSAFSGPARSEYGSGPRRLLSALAGSAPAFTPEPTGDHPGDAEFTTAHAGFGHHTDTAAPPDNTVYSEYPDADEELSTAVTAAAQGDRAALATIVESIRPLVVRYTRARFARTDTGPDPDDLAQEILLTVVTALPRYTAQGRPFLAFVYGIAAHKVAAAERAITRPEKPAAVEIPEDLSPLFEQRALEPETDAELSGFLATLPDQEREILILRLVLGLSLRDTAVAVNSTTDAVERTQERALTQLEKRFGTRGFTSG
ncbi:sigma-70 family RNA polymerase sigma factor [Nocardia brasiliensis]|uniref:sigma-70 family RNA polymerase sigma factor n=1 Tax=Nocardia brasiliensis TaxID=37326 RepID=UPI003CC8034C